MLDHILSAPFKMSWAGGGVLAIALLAVTGCGGSGESRPVQTYGEPPLDKGAIESLGQMSKTLGATFIIVGVRDLNPRKLAVEADRASGKVDEAQFWPLRWLFPRSGNAITYFYSEKPRLLQIRYGRYLSYRARLAHLDSGPEYNALQQRTLQSGTPDFGAISERITRDFTSQDQELPFYRRWPLQLVMFVDDEFLPLLTMPMFELWDGMASLIAVHIYNGVGGLVPNYFLFTATMILLVMLTFWIFVPIAVRFGTPTETPEGVQYNANSVPGCLVYLAFFAFLLIAVFPLFGFMVMSANQRVEDLLTLSAIGVNVRFDVPHELSWSLVLLLMVVTLAAQLTVKFMAFSREQELSEALDILKTLVVIPVAYLLLPAWAVVLATCLVVLGGLSAIVMSVLAGRKSNTQPPAPVASA